MTEKLESETPSDAATCSPRFVRMVVQLMDTPHNREVIEKIKAVASRVTSRVDGPHAVMKIEAITLESMCMAKPLAENAQKEARRK